MNSNSNDKNLGMPQHGKTIYAGGAEKISQLSLYSLATVWLYLNERNLG